MTQSYFNDMMEELGCRVIKNLALGVNPYGMPYSAELAQVGSSPELTLRFALDGPALPCVEYLQANPVEYTTALAYGEILECHLKLPTDFYTRATLHTLYKALRDGCAEKGLEACHTCPLCGMGRCDRYAFLAGPNPKYPNEQALFSTHAACLDARLPEVADHEVREAPEGNYFLGALGALIGAAIGIVPNWIQLVSKSKVSAIMYFLVPIFSSLLYRLLRGKRQHGYASVCIALASLLAAFGFEQIGYNYTLSLVHGHEFTLWESIQTYLQNLSAGTAISNMLLSLLFMFIGFIPASRLLQGYSRRGQTNNRLMYGAEFTRQSAMPIRPPEQVEEKAPAGHEDTKP